MIGALTGFAAGYFSHREEPGAAVPGVAPVPHNRVSPSPIGDGLPPSADEVTSRPRSATRKPEANDGPRVSVPLKSVVKVLKDGQLSYADFERLTREIDNAMTLLGVSAQDAASVSAYMKAMHAEILREEKTHVKVGRVDQGHITLDVSAMAEPSAAIAERTRQVFRESLAPEVAEALIMSIDWDKFYFRGDSREVSFRVNRSASGTLMATTATGWGTLGSGLSAEEYPDNGTPIPAAKVFDARWSQHLKDLTLLPVNE